MRKAINGLQAASVSGDTVDERQCTLSLRRPARKRPAMVQSALDGDFTASRATLDRLRPRKASLAVTSSTTASLHLGVRFDDDAAVRVLERIFETDYGLPLVRTSVSNSRAMRTRLHRASKGASRWSPTASTTRATAHQLTAFEGDFRPRPNESTMSDLDEATASTTSRRRASTDRSVSPVGTLLDPRPARDMRRTARRRLHLHRQPRLRRGTPSKRCARSSSPSSRTTTTNASTPTRSPRTAGATTCS